MTDKEQIPEDIAIETDTDVAEASSKTEVIPPDQPDTISPDRPKTVDPGGFLSPEALNALLRLGRTAMDSGTAVGEDRLSERLYKVEARLEEFIAGGTERDRRMEETNRAMRAYFTDELGRLREAITNELRIHTTQRLLQEVLPILNDLDDLLDRSVEASQDADTERLWRALEAYRRRFYNGLRRLGLEEMKVVENETMFDPYVHECVNSIEEESSLGGEELPPGTIVKVRRRGYLFQNELFQAPQVIIQGGESDGASQNHRD